MRFLFFILILISFISSDAQIPDGVYEMEGWRLLISGKTYKRYNNSFYLKLPNSERRVEVHELNIRDSGILNFKKDKLHFQSLISRKYYHYLSHFEIVDSVVRVTNQFKQSIELKRLKDSVSSYNEKYYLIEKAFLKMKFPKVRIRNIRNQKTIVFNQKSSLIVNRMFIGSLINGTRDTIAQTIIGNVTAISDSFLYINSDYFHSNNEYNLSYDFDWKKEKPIIDYSWRANYSDTIIKIPIGEVYYISKQSNNNYEIIGGLGIAALVNQLALPFYTYDYKNKTLNKSLFNKISIANLVAFFGGIIGASIQSEKYYATNAMASSKEIWKIEVIK